tara:strand:- start:5547 stop:7835 length:2289 start_codon:yes stop_codon:yes gene_type:complete
MSILGLSQGVIRSLKTLASTSASQTAVFDKLADTMRPLGQLVPPVESIPQGSFLDAAMDSKRLSQAIHSQVEGTVFDSINNYYRANIPRPRPDAEALDPRIFMESSDLTDEAYEKTKQIVNVYDRELRRLVGGEGGMRELMANVPGRLRAQLEGAVGELTNKISEDIPRFIESIENPNFQSGTLTDGNLSLKQLTDKDSIMGEHLRWLNENLKSLSSDFIASSDRYDTWEDFQRINWNDHIMDMQYKLIQGIENSPSPNARKKAMNELAKFNRENIPVFKKGGLVRADYLNMLHSSKKHTPQPYFGSSGEMGRIHYIGSKGDKYEITLQAMPDARLRALDTDTGFGIKGYPHEGRWVEGLPPDELNIPPEKVRHILPDSVGHGKMTRADLDEMQTTGMPAFLKQLNFEVKPIKNNRGKRFQKEFQNDIISEPTPGDFTLPKSAEERVNKWLMGESNSQTNDFMDAMRIFDFGRDAGAGNMSANSLGLIGVAAGRSKKLTERALRTGEDLGYVGQRTVYNIDQAMNTISHRRNTPIRNVGPDKIEVENILDDRYNAKMDGFMELKPVRRNEEGKLVRVGLGKNIDVDHYFQGINVHQGTKDSMRDVIREAIDLAEQGEVITIGNLKKMGKIKNPALKRNLPFVSSLVSSLGSGANTKLKKLLAPSGKTPEEFIDDITTLIGQEDRKFKQQFGNDAHIFADFGSTEFDDLGNIVGEFELVVRHSGVRVGHTIDANTILTKLPAMLGPILPGMKVSVKGDKKDNK